MIVTLLDFLGLQKRKDEKSMTQSRTRITELTRAGMVLAVIIVLAFFPGIPVGILPAPFGVLFEGLVVAGEVLGA